MEIYLDSRDSVTTQPPFSNTDWPTFRFVSPVQNIAKMKILEAEIPFSYYVVNNDSNRVTLTEASGTRTGILLNGNYTATTLASSLAITLTGASLGLGNRTYTVTYSEQTGRFTIDSSGSFTITIESPLLQTITGLPSVISSAGNRIVAPSVALVTGPNYVYVNSDTLGPSFETFLPSTALEFPVSKGPQLARIPITENPGGVTYYQDPVPEKWFDVDNLLQLQQFDLYVTLGNSSQKVRFNGQHFSIKLGIMVRSQVHSRYKDTGANSAIRSISG